METAVWFRIPNSPLRYLRILCAFALSSESPNYSLRATPGAHPYSLNFNRLT